MKSNRTLAVIFALTTALLSLAGTTAFSADAQPFEPRVGQAGKDVIWVPTADALVDKMLDMVKVTTNDFVMDLGSGDGRIVIAAARRGARAQGIEYNPDMVELSKRNAEKAGVSAKATFMKADIFESDFSQATVITKNTKLGTMIDPTIVHKNWDYRNFGDMFFDMKKDPLKVDNRIQDVRYQKQINLLRGYYNEFIDNTPSTGKEELTSQKNKNK